MVELESVLVPKLSDYVKKWRRFVEDRIKRGSIVYVSSVLNSYHDNIKFSYEQENNRLPFLDVFLIEIIRK